MQNHYSLIEKLKERILQNHLEKSKLFLKILNIQASLQKKNSSILPRSTRELGNLQEYIT